VSLFLDGGADDGTPFGPLAYQTLALVSQALNKLEVGQVAIARFGQNVEMLHGFDAGQFTSEAGSKVISRFTFKQTATNVLSMVDTSLKVLSDARDRRASGSASSGDLWQLEIIISDGICQDHDRLRTVLRKAEEQRVMIVFIVVDALHRSTAPNGNQETWTASAASAAENSILSMNQASLKMVNGKMEVQMERYLDSFPFRYYVVLRDVEALPDVLAGTLRQFFERVSES